MSDHQEARRLAAPQGLTLLDSEPEREFDALVALAADLLACPVALLSLVDRDRVWIKARSGPAPDELARDVAFCDVTIRNGDLLAINDLTTDARFSRNPIVVGAPGFRFYAGMPIHLSGSGGERQPVGTLCVLDDVPHRLDDRGRRALAHLATLAEALIAARGAADRAIELARDSDALATELARKDRIFRQAERMAMMGSFRLSVADERIEWSDNVYRIHGLPVGEAPPLNGALDHYAPDARARVGDALIRTIETGEPFVIEEDFITARSEHRRVRSLGELETLDGQAVAVVGVFQDITDRYELEKVLRRSADTDMLTGLCNRAAFERILEAAIDRARTGGTTLALVMIDLDGFKAINDTLGIWRVTMCCAASAGRCARRGWAAAAPRGSAATSSRS